MCKRLGQEERAPWKPSWHHGSVPGGNGTDKPTSPVNRFLTLPPLNGPLVPASVRLGLVLLVVLIRVPSFFEPPWYSDEGFFTTVAWVTARGVPLYSGIYDNQPPVIFWLYRVTQALGSLEHHYVVQLTATAAVALVALFTFEVSRRLVGQWPSTLAAALTGAALSLPVLDGDLLNVELAALPFFLAALLLAFSTRSALVLASGALLGVAIATRPSFALDGFALAIPLLSSDHRLRRLCLTACGVMLTGVLVTGALASQGSLAPYLAVVLPADHAYLVWSNGGSLLPLIVRLGALATVAVIGLRQATKSDARLAVVWLAAALAGAGLTPRELTHYSHEAIPPLAFAVALLVARVRRRWLAVVPAALAVIVGAEAALIIPALETALLTGRTPPPPLLHNFSYERLPAYYSNWLDLVFVRESAAAYANDFPDSPALDRSEAFFLKSQPGAADSRLIVLGDRPWLYVDTGMLPGSRYIATNSAFWRVPSAAADMTRALNDSCASFVVYTTGPGNWQPALDSGGYVPMPDAPMPTYRSTRLGVGCG